MVQYSTVQYPALYISPGTDWPLTWRLARLPGLGSELTSFLFKLIHNLLPTQDRIGRIAADPGGIGGLCQLCQGDVEDLLHSFFSCPKSAVAGLTLLGHAQTFFPLRTPETALRLEFMGDLSERGELAVVCLLATGLKFIWETRVAKKSVVVFKMRAELEAKVSILRKTRYFEAGDYMLEMINN